jgi:hypothetical protein
MRSLLAALALLLIAPADSSAQWLRGRVLDDASGLPIAGARLDLIASRGGIVATAISDEAGDFFVKAPLSDIYRLHAQAFGYGAATGHPITLLAVDTMQIEFRLAVEAVLLAPIVVKSKRFAQVPYNLIPFYERRQTYGALGLGRFFDASQVREYNGLPITSLLEQRGGVRFERRGNHDNVMVGRTNCPLVVFLDGVEAREVKTARDLESLVPTSAIGAVEVYTNTMPIEFATLTEVQGQGPPLSITVAQSEVSEDLTVRTNTRAGIYRACGAIALWSR